MTAPDILAALTPVVEALEALGIPYHVGGSVASSVLGTARATLDVDVVARLEDVDVAPFVYRMDPEYYVDEAMIRDAIARRSSFNLIHQATAIKIDVFVLKSRLYDQEAFARRHTDTLEDEPGAKKFWIASAEDLILNKLEWYQMGGQVSERQWNDVIGLFRVQQGHLDEAYLDRWAAALNLTGLLQRARESATER